MHQPLRLAFGVVLLGALLRFAVLAALPPQRLVGDERYYVEVAHNLAAGRGHLFERDGIVHRAFRPPAHPWLLSLALPGDGTVPESAATEAAPIAPPSLLLLQSLLGSLLVAVVIELGRALFGWREGLLAGLLAALDPTLVAHSHYLWSETLAALLLGGGLAACVAAQRASSAWPAAGAGVLFGLAALTREVALPIAAACALWLAATAMPPRGPALRRAALVLGLAAAVVAPWTLRNARLLDRVVPVATVGAFALREGNTFAPGDWTRSELAELKAFRAEYFAIPDEAARLDFARREALARVRAEQPLWLAKKLARTAATLWSPDSYLFLKLSRGAYGAPDPWIVRPLLLVATLGYVAIIVAAIAGAAGAEGRGRRAFPALVLGVFFGVHLLANSAARFRLPVLPLLLVYASHAALEPRRVLERARGGPRLAAAALVLVFLGVSVPSFFGDAVALWSTGAYPDVLRP
jgi:4-amino-4-deoxy-L-arabinose transferase-like glycosyltransferase